MSETITGLSLVIALACLGLVYVFVVALSSAWRYRLWSKTKAVPPEPGQVWNQHGSNLYVLSVIVTAQGTMIRLRNNDDGTKVEWEEELSTWRNRIRKNHLYLMHEESEKFRKSLIKGVD